MERDAQAAGLGGEGSIKASVQEVEVTLDSSIEHVPEVCRDAVRTEITGRGP